MIEASDRWKDIQQRFLLPETFVEIDCLVTEEGIQKHASASGSNEAVFSEVENVLGLSDTTTYAKYATLETNLWALDGSRIILPDEGPYPNAGYVSDIAQSGSVTLVLPEVHTTSLPGITINWSSEYGEYPPVFTVTAYNGDTKVSEITVTDNDREKVVVDLNITNYDRVSVTVHNWCLPEHRARIDSVFLGHMLTFTKNEITSFTHTQSGSLLSSELPKYSVTFSIDNTDNRWNPNNPSGMEQYLSERQKIIVRYGMDISGSTEWIKAGTFYLSEWSAPSNGMEATFVARDVFEFLISANMGAYVFGTLEDLVFWATDTLLPDDVSISIDASLADYTAEHVEEETAAEMLQKCANAACCILRCGRDGDLHIEPLNKEDSGFLIPLTLSYSHPEVSLSKPLKTVAVEYGGDTPYELVATGTGETETVSNGYITEEAQAALVAAWVRDVLKSRKSVSGEFRADPRLDLYDVVSVESKYGVFSPVVITEIQYSYNGAFTATYTGQVLA